MRWNEYGDELPNQRLGNGEPFESRLSGQMNRMVECIAGPVSSETSDRDGDVYQEQVSCV